MTYNFELNTQLYASVFEYFTKLVSPRIFQNTFAVSLQGLQNSSVDFHRGIIITICMLHVSRNNIKCFNDVFQAFTDVDTSDSDHTR